MNLVKWLGVRIARYLEKRLTERQQMLAMVEAEHRKMVDLDKAEREKMINLAAAAHERNKQVVVDVIDRSEQFVEGVIERMEEQLRCSTELDRIGDADTRNVKETKKAQF